MARILTYKKINSLSKYLITFGITLVICLIPLVLMVLIESVWANSKATLYLFLTLLVLLCICFFCLFRILYIFTEEIVYRLKYDSVTNLFKSIFQTIKIRRFLKIKQPFFSSEKIDPNVSNFNKKMSNSIIDIQQNRIVVYILIPQIQQPKNMLDESIPSIREMVSSYNENYFFSSPVRKKNYIIISGKPR